MIKKCKKKKLDNFEAQLLLAQSDMTRKFNKTSNRKEVRKYWCEQCKSYHLTKMEINI
jgi:hypothetical protein